MCALDMDGSPTLHLPTYLSSFIGRKQEITEIQQRVAANRLVTLTGPGGCGKTRLAYEAARGMQDEFVDGVWAPEFASLLDGALLPQAVASSLNLGEQSGVSLTRTLIDHLQSLQALLIFDNCEHLIADCALLVQTLLVSCPNLKILATSREPLKVSGEAVFDVPPLSMPDPQPWRRPSSPKQALPVYERSEAVRLFVERASSAAPKFSLDVENGPWIAEICRHLDGMPLAIELAAARVRSLSLRQIAGRLDDRFKLLTLGTRTSPERQQTLLATLDWSYELLTKEEQLLFRRLSVFAGGWTLEEVEDVCFDDRLQPSEVLDLLTSLVDKSFVMTTSFKGENRYGMLETVREYAKQRLTESGEQSRVQQKHAETFLEIVRKMVSGGSWLVWPRDANSVKQLEMEHDNFRAALGWSANHDLETAVQLAAKLAQFWQQRGYLGEGLKWFETILSSGHEISEPVRAESLLFIGYLSLYSGEFERVESVLKQAEEIYRKLNNPNGIGWQLVWLAWAKVAKGDYVEAIKLGQQACAILGKQEGANGTGVALAAVGEAEYLSGHFAEAEKTIGRSLDFFRETGILFAAGRRLTRLSQIALAQNEMERAAELARQGLIACVTAGDDSGVTMALAAMAAITEKEGEPRRAATILGAVAGLREIYGAAFWFFDQLEYDRCYEAVRSQLDSSFFKAAMEKGHAFNLDQSVQYALQGETQTEDLQAFGGLSAREREVASLIAQGKSNREIAAVMTVSEKTIETYVTRILNKLGFDKRVQIAVWAVERGLGPPK